jgi:hypothetical protein
LSQLIFLYQFLSVKGWLPICSFGDAEGATTEGFAAMVGDFFRAVSKFEEKKRDVSLTSTQKLYTHICTSLDLTRNIPNAPGVVQNLRTNVGA